MFGNSSCSGGLSSFTKSKTPLFPFFRVFRQAPDMVDLFERVNGKDIKSGEFTAHSMRVLGGLNMVISILDNQDGILEICLHHLKDQHKEMAIPRNYFQVCLGNVSFPVSELLVFQFQNYFPIVTVSRAIVSAPCRVT